MCWQFFSSVFCSGFYNAIHVNWCQVVEISGSLECLLSHNMLLFSWEGHWLQSSWIFHARAMWQTLLPQDGYIVECLWLCTRTQLPMIAVQSLCEFLVFLTLSMQMILTAFFSFSHFLNCVHIGMTIPSSVSWKLLCLCPASPLPSDTNWVLVAIFRLDQSIATCPNTLSHWLKWLSFLVHHCCG